jgi:hypothetical protein
MPRSAVPVLIAFAAVLAGCSPGATPTPAAGSPAPTWLMSGSVTPGASAGPSASAPVDDPPGALTCAALAAAIERSALMEPGVIDRIEAAAGTADAPVADAAQRLADAYATAVAAKGAADEPDRIAAVSAAAADMSGVCDDSGLETVG